MSTRMLTSYRDFNVSFLFLSCCRLAVSDCAPQTSRVSSNLHSSSSMAVSRVPSPPPPEVNTPVAENWCYTQVRFVVGGSLSSAGAPPWFSDRFTCAEIHPVTVSSGGNC